MSTRPPTPAPIARRLRQEAGFGCCVCGQPIIQYHHIVQYSDEAHFRPEDMMVLCPLHHDQATKNAFPEVNQRRAKANPYNIKHNRARGPLAVTQEYCAFQVGSVEMFGRGALIDVDGDPLLTLMINNDGYLALSVNLQREDGTHIAEIVENEWMTGDPLPWDLQAGWQHLKILQRRGTIALDIDARQEPIRIRAKLWMHSICVELDSAIRIQGNRLTLTDLCLVNVLLRLSSTGAPRFEPDSRLGSGYFVSEPSKAQRLAKAKELWLAQETHRRA